MPRLKRGMTIEKHDSAISRHDAPEFCSSRSPSDIRGRGECRAPDAPAAARVESNTRVSHHGHTANTRHSPHNGFTAYFVLSPVTGLVVTVACEVAFANLNASVGASGPHDFAVRLSAVRQRHCHVHRIPSRVRDDRETPLCRDGMAMILEVIWARRETNYFSNEAGRRWNQIDAVRHSCFTICKYL